MGDFTKLTVWKKAHDVALAVYRETARWPKHEPFGLTSQSRRAAFSVPANIAEGCGKNSDGELARHARDSMGSASELSYYLILAHDLGYMERARHVTTSNTACRRFVECSHRWSEFQRWQHSVPLRARNYAARVAISPPITVKLMADG